MTDGDADTAFGSMGLPASQENLSSVKLRGLIEPLERALSQSRIIVVLQQWQITHALPLLPFEVLLKPLTAHSVVPLNPTFAFVPYFEHDDALIRSSRYSVGTAYDLRSRARLERAATPLAMEAQRRALCGDLELVDWEQAIARNHSELRELELPGSAFIAIDTVRDDGRIDRGSRATLGRHTPRQAARPRLLVAGRSGLSSNGAVLFAGPTVLIANIQRVRGRRAIESARAALQARGASRPSLVVASSPADLARLELDSLLAGADVMCLGDESSIPQSRINLVGRDRALEDRRFEFVVEELKGTSPIIDSLIPLARSAWWALRQALGQDLKSEPELERFLRALDRARQVAPDDARLMDGAAAFLNEAAQCTENAAERTNVLTDLVLHASGEGILVSVRNGRAAASLRGEIARCLETSENTLEDLGVNVLPWYSQHTVRSSDVALAAGYFGPATLDLVMAARPRTLHLVLDPVEARALCYSQRSGMEWLRRAQATPALKMLDDLEAAVAPSAAVFADAVSISTQVSTLPPWDVDRNQERSSVDAALTEDVTLQFTDGSSLQTSPGARFDMLPTGVGGLRVVMAKELQPGDEVVLVEHDSRLAFSERLLASLDTGALKTAVEQRRYWLILAKSVYQTTKPKISQIAGRLTAEGFVVSPAAIRSWLAFDDDAAARVPQRRDMFLAFASALGIALPQEQLRELFGGIRRLRVMHRLAGRDLARAIRAAFLGRLDPATQARIERDWGVTALQLLHGARVATVDEIIVAPGGPDAPR